MISKCIVFTKPNKVEFAEIDLPLPGKGQVITKTIFSGVSTGTETRVLRGGEVDSFPLIPGYENVGEIVEIGQDVNLNIGDIVYAGSSEYTGKFFKCWGAQTEYALVNAENLIPLPFGLDPAAGLYAKVGGIALHGINRANINEKDTVAVVGLGLIGNLAAQCAKAKGAMVIGIDKDEARINVARQSGLDFLLDANNNIEKKVKEISNSGVDVAIDVTGIANTVDKTARLVHTKPWTPPYPPSARIVLLGSYSQPVTFTYHPTLFQNEP
ncbi:MAG: zinc-binding dehydrogenase, partial [candidate division WOR-3 bacterium]